LIGRGAFWVEPESGRFASGLVGQGRLPETPTLLGEIRRALGANGALRGRKVVVTAGGTREAIDPVRYVGNRSSGKQGYALAQSALDAGAHVTLISCGAAQALPTPIGCTLIKVTSAGYENGLLHIDLVREVPEHKKPRKVEIGTVANSPVTIEADQAAA